VDVVASRFEVFLVRLDPTEGRVIRKTRPCLIISPDEMNQHIDTVIVAPMTSKGRAYPTRVPIRFKGKSCGQEPAGETTGQDR
jgi:mRNA interferase MazF